MGGQNFLKTKLAQCKRKKLQK